jgi:hypothetical protein
MTSLGFKRERCMLKIRNCSYGVAVDRFHCKRDRFAIKVVKPQTHTCPLECGMMVAEDDSEDHKELCRAAPRMCQFCGDVFPYRDAGVLLSLLLSTYPRSFVLAILSKLDHCTNLHSNQHRPI